MTLRKIKIQNSVKYVHQMTTRIANKLYKIQKKPGAVNQTSEKSTHKLTLTFPKSFGNFSKIIQQEENLHSLNEERSVTSN